MAAAGAFFAALVIAVPNGFSATANTERSPLANSRVAATQHRDGVPFTGFDLALILGGGTALIAAGAGLRRAALKRT